MTDEQLLTAVWERTSDQSAEQARLDCAAAYERMEADMMNDWSE